MMKENLQIWAGRATPGLLPTIAHLFAETGNVKSPAHLAWQYLDCPGGAFVALAHDERGPVEGAGALYAAMPVRFQVRGSTYLGMQSFDTLTSASFRGQGLFPRLANVVYELAAKHGCSAVYGFPNESSFPGFKNKLRWQMLDPLPMWVRPIGFRYLRVRLGMRTPRIARNVPTGRVGSVTRVYDIPMDIDTLSASWMTAEYVGVKRNKEYLDWRIRRPDATYAFYEVRSSGGALEAFGISELRLKHGCTLGYVMELIYAPANLRAGRHVLRAIVDDFRHAEADLVLAWRLPAKLERGLFAGTGFLPFPPKIRPIKLHFGYRILEPSSMPAELSRADWYLSYLDSDTV